MRKEPSEAMRDRCWTKALHLKTFSYFDLASAAHCGVKAASAIVRDWVNEGVVKSVGKGDKNRLRFELVDPALRRPATVIAAERARRQTPVGNMWTAARGLKIFSARDLAAHATTDSLSVTYDTARDYCRTLLRAGYLKVVQTARPPEREAIYRLIRNSGPLPPAERRIRAIWDPNLTAYTIIGPSEGNVVVEWRDD